VALGVDGFLAFGLGTVVGGSSAFFVALPVALGLVARGGNESDPPARLGGLIAGNLFLTANMVAIPAVLRVHVDDLGASVVASLQIVVSLSRLTTLLVASGVSVVVAAAVRRPHGGVVLGAVVGATGLGAVAVLGSALLAPAVLPVVFGHDFGIDSGTAALAAVSAIFLNPAYVLTGLAVARDRSPLIAWGWAAGAVALAMVACWPGGLGSTAVLTGITCSAALPVTIIGLGLARRASLPDAPGPRDEVHRSP
jgi:hypothetical protein